MEAALTVVKGIIATWAAILAVAGPCKVLSPNTIRLKVILDSKALNLHSDTPFVLHMQFYEAVPTSHRPIKLFP